MRWTYQIKNKLLASVILLTLCLLVLLSHYLDRVHTEKVKTSISTLYEDRLMAENYILEMTVVMYEIRALLQSNIDIPVAALEALLDDFTRTYYVYSKTKLTIAEQETATDLYKNFTDFKQGYVANLHNSPIYTEKTLLALRNLSNIQLDESKIIMKEVESQYAAIKLSSQFVFALVILILVVLQLLVFSGESLVPFIKTKDPRLN